MNMLFDFYANSGSGSLDDEDEGVDAVQIFHKSCSVHGMRAISSQVVANAGCVDDGDALSLDAEIVAGYPGGGACLRGCRVTNPKF